MIRGGLNVAGASYQLAKRGHVNLHHRRNKSRTTRSEVSCGITPDIRVICHSADHVRVLPEDPSRGYRGFETRWPPSLLAPKRRKTLLLA